MSLSALENEVYGNNLTVDNDENLDIDHIDIPKMTGTNLSVDKMLRDLKVKTVDRGSYLFRKEDNHPINIYATRTAFVPELNRNYKFNPDTRDVLNWFSQNNPEPLYVHGPTGCGKTSCVNYVASCLNYPVFEVTGHDRLEFPEMAGHLSLENGRMVFQYGPLALAMKYGGVFLLNEIDLLNPSTAAGLNTVLDGRPLCIIENGGEIIKPHPMFRFVATANTNGMATSNGSYLGTLRQNIAFMDRFIVIQVDYPSEKIELEILKKAYPQIVDISIFENMLKMAKNIRRGFTGEDSEHSYEVTLSTRTLLRWAGLFIQYLPYCKRNNINIYRYTLDRALCFRATPDTRKAIHDLGFSLFGVIYGTDEQVQR